MSKSRAESQQSHYGRRRSNTTQSILRPTPVAPLVFGDSKLLNCWVHQTSTSASVLFNHASWPGVAEGDLISVSGTTSNAVFLFVVAKDEGNVKPQLQISVPEAVAEAFELRNNGEVTLTKLNKNEHGADYVEFIFQDQYLGRNDMWRLGRKLVGQCVFTNQEVTFLDSPVARIQNIYIDGKKVSSACMTTATKAIYRSLSARVTIFIQVCHELWEFAGDGERYNEKVVHSFLPTLFSKWREAGTNHIVTIVLISRVFYEASEIDYAAGPLLQTEEGQWYKDFYKVITDLEVIHEWKPTLVSLKDSFWDFQRDILLTHHYHRASQDPAMGTTDQVRLVGRLSFAHDGPILEALNLALNPTETHYIDRSLSLTGATTLVITPGTGYYRVNKQLLRLTTTRMLDQGFGLDLISLAKPPLHQSPIFSFPGYEPEHKPDMNGKTAFASDPLWGGDDASNETGGRKTTLWWEPFWISITFWDQQMDLPFRKDRFLARAKMHQIQMLGLLELDVLSSIEIPFLPDKPLRYDIPPDGVLESEKEDMDQFDMDVFKLTPKNNSKPRNPGNRTSLLLSTGGGLSMPQRNTMDKRNRNSVISHRIAPIEESPAIATVELPTEEPVKPQPVPIIPRESSAVAQLRTSSSRSSMRSVDSTKSAASSLAAHGVTKSPASRKSIASKLAPNWLLNSFRSAPSEPQTSQISASALPPPPPNLASTTSPKSSPIRMPAASKPIAETSVNFPIPMTIKGTSTNRVSLSRTFEEETFVPHRSSHLRLSPNTPPQDSHFPKRRSIHGDQHIPGSSSSPVPLTNPSQPQSAVPRAQSSLARRWQHMFPHVLYKHELKWKSIVTPGCLPLTVEYFPTMAQLESSYDVFSYDFVIDPGEMRSFLVRPPTSSSTGGGNTNGNGGGGGTGTGTGNGSGNAKAGMNMNMNMEELRRAWALVVMRGMAAVRLAQGFQFVIAPKKKVGESQTQSQQQQHGGEKPPQMKRSGSFLSTGSGGGGGGSGSGGGGSGGSGSGEYGATQRKPVGAAEVLASTTDAVYLSMSNEIHCISYTGEVIQVRRYVRRLPVTPPFVYKCLIWPKLGGGYTELTTTFSSHGMENYGWNRLDMLVASYEHHFNESLRYWRTRFVIIPTAEPPDVTTGPTGEKLNEEEARILGIEKLAEQFTKMRWQPNDDDENSQANDKSQNGGNGNSNGGINVTPSVRFLPTTLDPAASVLDIALMDQLDQIHAAGPLRKKMNSQREIGEFSLSAIAKAMREEEGMLIKYHQWHRSQYPNSFTGYDFVSWLVREFRDVSSRAQGAEWGVRLLEQGLFEHCRGSHGFLDGHYIYRLKGEYSVPMTPRGWFRRYTPNESLDLRSSHYPSSTRPKNVHVRRSKRRLILSQSMVIDIDPARRSDQAEAVILHHDIIHNPATVFHFELQWIGTTARLIEDALRQWNRTIGRYGLKLVEAYVTQISDIRERNAFQSCFPLRLALAPPIVPDIERRVPEGTQTARYFEYALLKRFGFIVDVEAADLYPEQIDVVYSYRRSPYKYSQFVHRSGVAFVQVLGGAQGFLFLTNRLIGPGRMGAALKNKDLKPAAAADDIRAKLEEFCSNVNTLSNFYDEELGLLSSTSTSSVVEEPPLLVI